MSNHFSAAYLKFPGDDARHPTINPFINPDHAKDAFNTRHPADDVANYLQSWSSLLQQNGYTPGKRPRRR